MTKSYDAISIKNRKEQAWTHVTDLDSGARHWTMSIPPDFHYDSDELICAALEDIDYLLAESAQRLTRIAELEAKLARLEEAYDNDAGSMISTRGRGAS